MIQIVLIRRSDWSTRHCALHHDVLLINKKYESSKSAAAKSQRQILKDQYQDVPSPTPQTSLCWSQTGCTGPVLGVKAPVWMFVQPVPRHGASSCPAPALAVIQSVTFSWKKCGLDWLIIHEGQQESADVLQRPGGNQMKPDLSMFYVLGVTSLSPLTGDNTPSGCRQVCMRGQLLTVRVRLACRWFHLGWSPSLNRGCVCLKVQNVPLCSCGGEK